MRTIAKKITLMLALISTNVCIGAEENLEPSEVFIDNSCIKKNLKTPRDSASKTQKVSCPSEDFAQFLKQFVNDESTQRAFTRFPLLFRGYSGDASEPKEYVKKLSRKKVKFPIILSCKKRQEIPLEIRLVSASEKKAQIRIEKPDTDWLTFYVFEKDKKSGCWTLTEINDSTL